ncbi:MAG: hypothetical protein NTU90_01900 [Proteobacteria bacterium]|nr:hypothetical protein [Pseudomonadota bacterium]
MAESNEVVRLNDDFEDNEDDEENLDLYEDFAELMTDPVLSQG